MNAGALSYISSLQQVDGSFLSLSSPDPLNFSEALSFKTTFSNALILSCLCSLEQNFSVKEISKKLAGFLLSQKSPNGGWNYWSRDSSEFQDLSYPDDLDDTFCVLSALYLYDKKIISPQVLSQAVQLLTTCEVQEGGPYKTWLVADDAPEVWQDVDQVVNVNIGFFLSLQGICLPSLDKLFKESLESQHFTSPYYPTSYPFFYFLSRFAKGSLKKSLQKILLEDHQPKTALNTALWTSALLNVGVSPTKVTGSVEYLKGQQQKDGSWMASAFYTGVNPKKDKTFYGGSSVLTTVLCLEALHKYELALKPPTPPESGIYDTISQQLLEEFKALPDPLHKIGLTQLKKIQKREKVIFLLPSLFGQDLKVNLPESFYIELGKANVLGWIAYTIYDDFLDNEGHPELLSFANYCLRQLTTIFLKVLPNNPQFEKLFAETMNALDASNTWEVLNCRSKTSFPQIDLHKLSQKSMGHALGVFAVLSAAGREDQIERYQQFFHYYLVAKQLNDDAHDVFADLKKGFFTPVFINIL